MTTKDEYPAGMPCWVDSWQADPAAALEFYGPLLGWDFDDAAPMPQGLDGAYFTARIGGRRVAGIGQAPPSSPVGWMTYVRVERIEQTLERADAVGGVRLAGPLRAGPDGRLAVLADPTGVAFGLWEAGDRAGAELISEPGAWAMSSLHSPDIGRARTFYAALFGWELTQEPGVPFAQWQLAGQVIAVASSTDGVTVPPHWAVNFATGDVDALADHALALGGQVLMAPFDTPGFRNAVLADPQGGVIATSSARG